MRGDDLVAQVKHPEDLVKIEMTDRDINLGISYGIISRAWTYDRMGAQARGDFGKAIFRIAVGKAVQAAVERYLSGLGMVFKRDTTNYRTTDYWDIGSSTGKSVDIKSFQFFSDYPVPGRTPLDPSHIVSSTLGESWQSFYPMLIPQDQFDRQAKDYYVFAILSAPMSKRCPYTHNTPRGLVALPYSQDERMNRRFQMVHFARFAERRIRSGQTFEVLVTSKAPYSDPINIVLGYAEATGETKYQRLNLNRGETGTVQGVTALHYLKWEKRRCPPSGSTLLEVTFNGVDNIGSLTWEVSNTSFEDIWIYPNELWCIGWINKEAFSAQRQKHPTYGPSGNVNRSLGSGGGILHNRSFCYFYPPVPRGGTKNENYYVLPLDLNTMNTLPAYLV
jgi:hypothetical protein